MFALVSNMPTQDPAYRPKCAAAECSNRAEGDLRLAGQVITAAQHIGEREGACFQAGQQVRTGGTRLASLLQRRLALLGGQGRECHEGFLSTSRAGTAASGTSRPSWRATAAVRAAA